MPGSTRRDHEPSRLRAVDRTARFAASVAIVGVGAVGVAVITYLERAAARARVSLSIRAFDGVTPFGPGIAYQRDAPSMLLNRTANRMSALDEAPQDFTDWLASKGYDGLEDNYIPRSVFGQYLQDRLQDAVSRLRSAGSDIALIPEMVDTIRRCCDGFELCTPQGSTFSDYVILCTGNAVPSRFEHLQGCPGFHPSPYPMERLAGEIPKTDSVGIVGTRLAAVDASLGLLARGHTGPLIVTSRSGRLPVVQNRYRRHVLTCISAQRIARERSRHGGDYPMRVALRLVLEELRAAYPPGFKLRHIRNDLSCPEARFRDHVARAESGDQTWQSVLVSLNDLIEQIWDGLDEAARQTFIEQHESRYLADRVPIPLANARRLLGAIDAGQVRILPGFMAASPITHGFDIWIKNDAGHQKAIRVDHLVDATGFACSAGRRLGRLYDRLLDDGAVRTHPLGGVAVDFATNQIIDKQTRPVAGLYAIGNMTKGTYFFCSVLELNVRHARRVAQHVVSLISRTTTSGASGARSFLPATLALAAPSRSPISAMASNGGKMMSATYPAPTPSDLSIKVVSSCIRRPESFDLSAAALVDGNPSPKDGDLVLVRCLDSKGTYDSVDDWRGIGVRLYRGDVFVGVLGTRRSGTKLTGAVPQGKLKSGDRLDLIAIGGQVGQATSKARYSGAKALPLEVLGFFSGPQGKVANIADARILEPSTSLESFDGNCIFVVAGTSAEAGKTTFVCNFNIGLKKVNARLKTAAIKACGTGRPKDSIVHRGANYDVVVDFVDAGWPTTYAIDGESYQRLLSGMLRYAFARAEIVVVELGGDFLDACAPEALSYLVGMGARCGIVVNDAMGALEGMRRLRGLGANPFAVSCFQQNLVALAQRLGMPEDRVMDSKDDDAMEHLARAFLMGEDLQLIPPLPFVA